MLNPNQKELDTGVASKTEGVSTLQADTAPEENRAEVESQKNLVQSVEPVLQDNPKATLNSQEPLGPKPARNIVWGVVALVCGLIGIALLTHNTPVSPRFTRSIGSHVPITKLSGQGEWRKAVDPNAEFYRKLNESSGPNANYHIAFVSLGQMSRFGAHVGAQEMAYPSHAVPDGYTIYNLQSVMDEFGNMMPGMEPGVIFLPNDLWHEALRPPGGVDYTRLATHYRGKAYTRGWIASGQVDALKNGHKVYVFSSNTISDPTLPKPSMPVTLLTSNLPKGMICFDNPRDPRQPRSMDRVLTPAYEIKEGQKVVLNEHTWENFPETTLAAYAPPEWAKKPGIFDATSRRCRGGSCRI